MRETIPLPHPAEFSLDRGGKFSLSERILDCHQSRGCYHATLPSSSASAFQVQERRAGGLISLEVENLRGPLATKTSEGSFTRRLSQINESEIVDVAAAGSLNAHEDDAQREDGVRLDVALQLRRPRWLLGGGGGPIWRRLLLEGLFIRYGNSIA